MNNTIKLRQNKAVFLDRDGVINIEKNYVFKVEDFKFRPEVLNILKSVSDNGYLIIVITNQSGIARGFYSKRDFDDLTVWMIKEMSDMGIHVKKVYHCPHHPEITGECNCRKPKPGLILKAIEEFDINPQESIMIGDKESDILAGEGAGLGKNLYIQELLMNEEVCKDLLKLK